MALFSDGPIISVLELQNFESSVLGVANTEGIDLQVKITLAQEDIANQLNLFLLQRLPGQGIVGPTRSRSTANDIVVTPPLKQWHAHKALAMIYRDAYNSQLNDRYRAKLTEYEQLAKLSRETYLRTGVAVAADPILRPLPPAITTVAGPGTAASYYLSVTWVNQAGQEGAPSDISQASTEAGELLVLTASNPPGNVVGWNVYLGTTPNALSRQTDEPIAISESWTAGPEVKPGSRPGEGQEPTWFVRDQRVMDRG